MPDPNDLRRRLRLDTDMQRQLLSPGASAGIDLPFDLVQRLKQNLYNNLDSVLPSLNLASMDSISRGAQSALPLMRSAMSPMPIESLMQQLGVMSQPA